MGSTNTHLQGCAHLGGCTLHTIHCSQTEMFYKVCRLGNTYHTDDVTDLLALIPTWSIFDPAEGWCSPMVMVKHI